jgi:hypothetical protein
MPSRPERPARSRRSQGAACARLLAASLLAGVLAGAPGAAGAQAVRLLVQSSPLAGFRYHEAPAVFPEMRVGDELTLAREPDNPHDASAVRVEWRGRRLGYVPRAQNDAIAWAMDRGEPLSARVSRLQAHRNPRRRIEFEIFVQ